MERGVSGARGHANSHPIGAHPSLRCDTEALAGVHRRGSYSCVQYVCLCVCVCACARVLTHGSSGYAVGQSDHQRLLPPYREEDNQACRCRRRRWRCQVRFVVVCVWCGVVWMWHLTCGRFIHRNIFFKFPDDAHNLYGGETFAMKSASHEARGIRAYLEAEARICHVHAQHRRCHLQPSAHRHWPIRNTPPPRLPDCCRLRSCTCR